MGRWHIGVQRTGPSSAAECQRLGQRLTPDLQMPVLCQVFEVVYRVK